MLGDKKDGPVPAGAQGSRDPTALLGQSTCACWNMGRGGYEGTWEMLDAPDSNTQVWYLAVAAGVREAHALCRRGKHPWMVM